jgi:hypothetical protein
MAENKILIIKSISHYTLFLKKSIEFANDQTCVPDCPSIEKELEFAKNAENNLFQDGTSDS